MDHLHRGAGGAAQLGFGVSAVGNKERIEEERELGYGCRAADGVSWGETRLAFRYLGLLRRAIK